MFCSCRTTSILRAFSNVCKDMVVGVESEQQGYYICPLLTLNLIKWYESVGSLSPKRVAKCKCGIQTEKSHYWFRQILLSSNAFFYPKKMALSDRQRQDQWSWYMCKLHKPTFKARASLKLTSLCEVLSNYVWRQTWSHHRCCTQKLDVVLWRMKEKRGQMESSNSAYFVTFTALANFRGKWPCMLTCRFQRVIEIGGKKSVLTPFGNWQRARP